MYYKLFDSSAKPLLNHIHTICLGASTKRVLCIANSTQNNQVTAF